MTAQPLESVGDALVDITERLYAVEHDAPPSDRARQLAALYADATAALQAVTEAREAAVGELRRQGMSLAEIAQALGMSRQRAHQLAQRDQGRAWGPAVVRRNAPTRETDKDEWTARWEAFVLGCYAATNGYLVNRRGRQLGIDGDEMLRKGGRMLAAYASEELTNHLLDHPRPTRAKIARRKD
jgi:hypothetical protein